MGYFDTLTRFHTLGNPSKIFGFILDLEQQSRKSSVTNPFLIIDECKPS
jgi:hypothetical protein